MPRLSEDVISFSECRNNLAACLKRVGETHRLIFITQNGRPTSVLISIVDWEPIMSEWENEQRIAAQVLEDLRIGEAQFARGECHSNAEVRDMMRKEFGL